MSDCFWHHIKCCKNINLSLKYCAIYSWKYMNIISMYWCRMELDVQISIIFAKFNFSFPVITIDCMIFIDNFDRTATETFKKHFYFIKLAFSNGKITHQTWLIYFSIILLLSTLFLTRKHDIPYFVVTSSSNFISK